MVLRAPPRPRQPWSPLRIVATVVAIVVVVLGLAAVTIYLLVMNSFNQRPVAVSAPIAWKSGEVVLSPQHPTSAGYLSVTASGPPTSNTVVGVNAGLPVAAASLGSGIDPAALLSLASVRFSVTTRGQADTQSCFAPCEMFVRSGFKCDPGPCRLDVDLRLELVPEIVPSVATVTIGVSGAVAGDLSNPLPAGVLVEFAAEGAPDGN